MSAGPRREELRFLVIATPKRRQRPHATDTLGFTNHSFATTPGDPDLPDEPFVDDLQQVQGATKAIFGPGATSGASRVTRQPLVLRQNEGSAYALDARYVFAGCPVQVRVGLVSATTIAEHQIIDTGVCDQPTITTTNFSTTIRDAKDLLSVPLQKNLYTGVGPLEGEDTGLAGTPKPLQIGGPSFHVTPKCVNAAKAIHQVNDGFIYALTSVWNRGIELSFSGFYASEADLLNDSLAPAFGDYKIYQAGGMFRVHANTIGRLACSPIAPVDYFDRSVAKSFQWILERAGYYVSQINLDDIAALHAAKPSAVELHIDDLMTGQQAADLILNSAGAGSWPDALGVMRCARLDEPPEGDVVGTIIPGDVLSISKEPTADTDRGRPVSRAIVRHSHNYTVTTDLADDVSPEMRALFTTPYQQVVRDAPEVLDLYPDTDPFVIDARWTDPLDADNEAVFALRLRKKERPRFQVRIPYTRATAAWQLNDIVGLQHAGFGLPLVGDEIGRRFRILGLAPVTAGTERDLVVTLWGNSLEAKNIAARDGRLLRARNGNFLVSRSA